MRLALVPVGNSPGKHDASGAFHPEAKRWVAAGGIVACFDNRAAYPKRARACLEQVRQYRPETLAFFCHGLKSSLQAGFRKQANVGELATACVHAGVERIVLYACEAGKPGGLAQELHRLSGIPVYAHTTSGHTTCNPYVVVYDRDRPLGEYLVKPGSARWRDWVEALRGHGRFAFPFLPVDDVLSL